jgi:hypothetical protein
MDVWCVSTEADVIWSKSNFAEEAQSVHANVTKKCEWYNDDIEDILKARL